MNQWALKDLTAEMVKRCVLSLQFQMLSIGAESGSLSTLYFPLLMDCLSRKLSLEYQTEVSIHTENVFSLEYEVAYLTAPTVSLKNKLPIASRFLRDANASFA